MAVFLYERKCMTKLIFTSRCIRYTSPEHLQNYVRYISTREGVEKVDEKQTFTKRTRRLSC